MIKYAGLRTLENLENAKQYNRWIIDQFRDICVSPLLEVGSGTGNIATYLKTTEQLFLSDNDTGLVKNLKKKFIAHKHISVFRFDITKQPDKRYKNSCATVIAINVLEHIEDDIKALQNLRMCLKKQGRIGILVPAKRFAYTDLDKKLGHFRRYEENELREKLEKGGFIVEKVYPFNIVGLLGWFVFHKVPRSSHELSAKHIKLFEFFVPVLRIVESVMPIPAGISYIAIARKKS
jgi:SAM-dependent methyltransferase